MTSHRGRIQQPGTLLAVFALAALLRLGLFSLTSLPRLLENRPELSTPITSFKSRKSTFGFWLTFY